MNYAKHTNDTAVNFRRGKDSIFKRCLYGQSLQEIQLEYVRQFWEGYPENRKFFRTHFSNNHEIIGHLVHYMDNDLAMFLEEFYKKGYFKDTIITILSDHGMHLLSLHLPMLPDNSRRLEVYLPVLFHIVPNDIPPYNLEILKSNEQSFISSYDIYTSLNSIANNKIKRSINAKSYSYFSEFIPDNHD